MRLIVLASACYTTFLTLFACSNVSGGYGESANDTLKYSYKTASFIQKDGSVADSTLLFRSKIIYPDFVFKSDNVLKDSVMHFISYSVFRGYSTAAEAAKAFVDDCIVQTKGMDGASMKGWESSDSVSVITNIHNLLSLKISHYSFTGGAHGNPSESYVNFNTVTGKRIAFEDAVDAAKVNKLKGINIKYFKEVKKLPEGATLEESGFFVKGDDLPLPSSFAITREGLLMSYNYYEIAPYSDGVIAYTIPFELLNGVLKEEYILGK